MTNESLTKLIELYHKSPIIKSLFKYWSTYTRSISEHKTSMLYDQCREHGTYRQMLHALRDIEQTGCGKLLLGRRGSTTRFVWHEDMLDTMTAVTQGKAITTTKHTHVFNLKRSDTMIPIEVSIPSDFTEKEAARMCDFIKSCAM